MERFELKTLRDYFKNIIAGCDNNEIPYIRGIAECGLELLHRHGIS